MKKVIVIGASSGIGRELAKLFIRNGFTVGITGRRLNLLEELQEDADGRVLVSQMDISKPEESVLQMRQIIETMGGLDVLVISSGTGHINPSLEWEYENETIDVNVKGFTALACAGMQYFIQKGSGHLVAISSVAALRGSADCPAYNASKAYMSNYLEGLASKARAYGKGIAVTDIKPGCVDTAMAQGEGLFWVASREKAAKQIYRMIERRKPGGYVTKRWTLVAFLFRMMPRRLYTLADSRSERARLVNKKK